MARAERVLAVDIGSACIKAGEFEYAANGAVTLAGFAIREYGEEITDANRSMVIESLLQDIIRERGFTARKVMLSLSGQSAFIRFVKLPPVSTDEKNVRQIVEFEARQNVPFPMAEVIWDYQLIASTDMDEMDVMFVVIKNEIVEQITNIIQRLGMQPVVVDIAPVASYNAARANHVGDEESTVILNIGSRSSNLLFADRNRFYARTIPIAGHAITQQIAKEFNIGMAEAEEMKRRHGFVALGGAYEEPESEVAATVSKIVRNVMARLHGEISRSITVYRSSQKGKNPVRMFLAGGSSTMGFTARFFQEACNLEVEYLNPFQVVGMAPGVDVKQLEDVAHLFSEVVGMGLRYKLQCPVEISLMPEKLRRIQAFNRKKPYLLGAAAAVLVGGALAVFAAHWKAQKYNALYANFEPTVGRLTGIQNNIKKENALAAAANHKYVSAMGVIQQRNSLPEILNTLQTLKPVDVWVVKLLPIYNEIKEVGTVSANQAAVQSEAGGGAPTAMFGPGGFGPGPSAPAPGPGGKPTSSVAGGSFKIVGFEIQGHSVAVLPDPSADPALASPHTDKAPANIFLKNIRENPLFDGDKKMTDISIYGTSESVRNLNSFTMQVKLKQPIEVKRN